MITYVWNNYPNKLTGQMILEANQAYLQQPLFKSADLDFRSIFKSALEGMKLGHELLLSIDVLPHTGMEVIFGRLSIHPDLD